MTDLVSLRAHFLEASVLAEACRVLSVLAEAIADAAEKERRSRSAALAVAVPARRLQTAPRTPAVSVAISPVAPQTAHGALLAATLTLAPPLAVAAALHMVVCDDPRGNLVAVAAATEATASAADGAASQQLTAPLLMVLERHQAAAQALLSHHLATLASTEAAENKRRRRSRTSFPLNSELPPGAIVVNAPCGSAGSVCDAGNSDSDGSVTPERTAIPIRDGLSGSCSPMFVSVVASSPSVAASLLHQVLDVTRRSATERLSSGCLHAFRTDVLRPWALRQARRAIADAWRRRGLVRAVLSFFRHRRNATATRCSSVSPAVAVSSPPVPAVPVATFSGPANGEATSTRDVPEAIHRSPEDNATSKSEVRAASTIPNPRPSGGSGRGGGNRSSGGRGKRQLATAVTRGPGIGHNSEASRSRAVAASQPPKDAVDNALCLVPQQSNDSSINDASFQMERQIQQLSAVEQRPPSSQIVSVSAVELQSTSGGLPPADSTNCLRRAFLQWAAVLDPYRREGARRRAAFVASCADAMQRRRQLGRRALAAAFAAWRDIARCARADTFASCRSSRRASMLRSRWLRWASRTDSARADRQRWLTLASFTLSHWRQRRLGAARAKRVAATVFHEWRFAFLAAVHRRRLATQRAFAVWRVAFSLAKHWQRWPRSMVAARGVSGETLQNMWRRYRGDPPSSTTASPLGLAALWERGSATIGLLVDSSSSTTSRAQSTPAAFARRAPPRQKPPAAATAQKLQSADDVTLLSRAATALLRSSLETWRAAWRIRLAERHVARGALSKWRRALARCTMVRAARLRGLLGGSFARWQRALAARRLATNVAGSVATFAASRILRSAFAAWSEKLRRRRWTHSAIALADARFAAGIRRRVWLKWARAAVVARADTFRRSGGGAGRGATAMRAAFGLWLHRWRCVAPRRAAEVAVADAFQRLATERAVFDRWVRTRDKRRHVAATAFASAVMLRRCLLRWAQRAAVASAATQRADRHRNRPRAAASAPLLSASGMLHPGDARRCPSPSSSFALSAAAFDDSRRQLHATTRLAAFAEGVAQKWLPSPFSTTRSGLLEPSRPWPSLRSDSNKPTSWQSAHIWRADGLNASADVLGRGEAAPASIEHDGAAIEAEPMTATLGRLGSRAIGLGNPRGEARKTPAVPISFASSGAVASSEEDEDTSLDTKRQSARSVDASVVVVDMDCSL